MFCAGAVEVRRRRDGRGGGPEAVDAGRVGWLLLLLLLLFDPTGGDDMSWDD